MVAAQLNTHNERNQKLRNAFEKVLRASPTQANAQILKATWLETPLGPMLTIADQEKLYLLEFIERRGLKEEIENLRKKLNVSITPGETNIIQSIRSEIAQYFAGKHVRFNTPIHLMGTAFQKRVWGELKKIPLSETCSYLDIAKSLNKPTAFRAVAQANGANQLAIIIPCHRVINTNGNLGGYAAGLTRKQWLLEHEKSQGKNHG